MDWKELLKPVSKANRRAGAKKEVSQIDRFVEGVDEEAAAMKLPEAKGRRWFKQQGSVYVGAIKYRNKIVVIDGREQHEVEGTRALNNVFKGVKEAARAGEFQAEFDRIDKEVETMVEKRRTSRAANKAA